MNTTETVRMRDATASVDMLHTRIEAACAQACSMIAPAWPLDRAIAVNPHWGRVNRPLRQVAARMAVLGDIRVFPPRPYILQAWNEQRITAQDLDYALTQLITHGANTPNAEECIVALKRAPDIAHLPLLIDLLDDDPQRHTRLSWRQAITHQVSQTCAAYFDVHQAQWQPDREPDQRKGLYDFWRDTLTHDHGISVLMNLPDLGKQLDALPETRQAAEQWALQRLGLPHNTWAEYLEAVLLTVNGWASWCAYLGWQAHLDGRKDSHLRELLAIRLAWGAILLECKPDTVAQPAFAALQASWREAPVLLAHAERALQIDEIWQMALEAGYQRQLARKLINPANHATASATAIEIQAAFCIDVRSERLRRALEAASPAIQTVGCAGFFGLPVAYTPLATQARRPQLPGLLAPSLEVTDCIVPVGARRSTNSTRSMRAQDTVSAARQRSFAGAEHWGASSRWPGGTFSFVEAAGLGYLGKLARWLHPTTAARAREDLTGLSARFGAWCRPMLTGIDLDAKVGLAAQVLHALGLDHDLAPLVLLVGHGSQSTNNAHAAGLDCGACCGQTGEVNARALACLLNDPEVRRALAAKGIAIPAQTQFVAALHNTTTDEVEWFDLDLAPATASAGWDRVQAAFDLACDQVRRERAPSLGLNPPQEPQQLLTLLRRRANDGAQTRPEWGLANNAAFIIAPRQRTRGALLDGRCFLHDYDAAHDADGSVLELLITAPMLVTHWINWQYHASTCDAERLGSGNKLLHNVVGGHIGVFEGNGGDLRIGLPRQSLHDGQRWVHEPLRLTVAIEAPQHAIDRVIDKHKIIRDLLANGWLHLWHLDGERISQYTAGVWHTCQLAAAR